MRGVDLSSWQGLLATVLGIALITLIGVGIRLLAMVTIQQRRERTNRQINERLRTLMAAYRTLGGSFTGDLSVDPTHLRDLRDRSEPAVEPALDLSAEKAAGSDRTRRIRDAVEAALSDIILLGTETHVRLAERAVRELVAGRPVHTHELVVALRDFIREALDLDPIPSDLAIPMQGPTRPSNGGGGRGERGGEGGRQGGGSGGGGMGGGGDAGIAVGMSAGAASRPASSDTPDMADLPASSGLFHQFPIREVMASQSVPTPADEVIARVNQQITDTLRKQQENSYAPWQLAFAGMTAGAAFFAAGVAFARYALGF